ncbi:hypothetical protein, partial, partial [Parasitella parasitica]
FEVEDIRDHRYRSDGEIEYLVKWSGYSERENEYITADMFSTPLPIKKYWEKVKQNNELQKKRKADVVKQHTNHDNASREVRHKRKAGTPQSTKSRQTRRTHI